MYPTYFLRRGDHYFFLQRLQIAVRSQSWVKCQSLPWSRLPTVAQFPILWFASPHCWYHQPCPSARGQDKGVNPRCWLVGQWCVGLQECPVWPAHTEVGGSAVLWKHELLQQKVDAPLQGFADQCAFLPVWLEAKASSTLLCPWFRLVQWLLQP